MFYTLIFFNCLYYWNLRWYSRSVITNPNFWWVNELEGVLIGKRERKLYYYIYDQLNKKLLLLSSLSYTKVHFFFIIFILPCSSNTKRPTIIFNSLADFDVPFLMEICWRVNLVRGQLGLQYFYTWKGKMYHLLYWPFSFSPLFFCLIYF